MCYGSLGNYSLFIRPGAERIDISAIDSNGHLIPDSATDPYGLMISAYRNPDNNVVLVAINYSDNDKEIDLQFPNKGITFKKSYTTSDCEAANLSLKKVTIKSGSSVTIPAKSIVTFTE